MPGHIQHGHARTVGGLSPTYHTWQNMLRRTSCPSATGYKYYGGRGITVCERWRRFQNFLADMGERPSAAYSLERKNNDLGYMPENCVWATRNMQATNKRNTRWLTFQGETLCLSEWSRRTGIGLTTLRARHIAELPPEVILSRKDLRHARAA